MYMSLLFVDIFLQAVSIKMGNIFFNCIFPIFILQLGESVQNKQLSDQPPCQFYFTIGSIYAYAAGVLLNVTKAVKIILV